MISEDMVTKYYSFQQQVNFKMSLKFSWLQIYCNITGLQHLHLQIKNLFHYSKFFCFMVSIRLRVSASLGYTGAALSRALIAGRTFQWNLESTYDDKEQCKCCSHSPPEFAGVTMTATVCKKPGSCPLLN